MLHYQKKGGEGSIGIQIGPLLEQTDGSIVKIPHYAKSSTTYQRCNLELNKHNAATWSSTPSHLNSIILRLPEKNYLSIPGKESEFNGCDPLSEFERVKRNDERKGLVIYASGGNPVVLGSTTPNPSAKVNNTCANFEKRQLLSNKNLSLLEFYGRKVSTGIHCRNVTT